MISWFGFYLLKLRSNNVWLYFLCLGNHGLLTAPLFVASGNKKWKNSHSLAVTSLPARRNGTSSEYGIDWNQDSSSKLFFVLIQTYGIILFICNITNRLKSQFCFLNGEFVIFLLRVIDQSWETLVHEMYAVGKLLENNYAAEHS